MDHGVIETILPAYDVLESVGSLPHPHHLLDLRHPTQMNVASFVPQLATVLAEIRQEFLFYRLDLSVLLALFIRPIFLWVSLELRDGTILISFPCLPWLDCWCFFQQILGLNPFLQLLVFTLVVLKLHLRCLDRHFHQIQLLLLLWNLFIFQDG